MSWVENFQNVNCRVVGGGWLDTIGDLRVRVIK